MGISHNIVDSLWKDLSFYGIYKDDIFQKKPVKQKRSRRSKKTITDLLDKLDGTFDLLRKSKIKTGFAQAIIKKFGCYVSNDSDEICSDNLEGYKAYGFPTFIAAYLGNETDETSSTTLVAEKITAPDFSKPQEGKVYYRAASVHKWGADIIEPCYCIEVDIKTGNVRPLRSICQKQQHYPVLISKGGKSKGSYMSYNIISHNVIDYPDIRDPENEEQMKEDVTEFLKGCFISAFNLTMLREHGINIIIKKGKYRATFVVPNDEWKYFFKDRVHVTVNGKPKRIFHAVASHTRKTKKSGFSRLPMAGKCGKEREIGADRLVWRSRMGLGISGYKEG